MSDVLLVQADSATGALRQLVVASPDLADGQIGPPGTVTVGVDADDVGPDPAAWLAAHYVAGGVVLPRASIAATFSAETIAADGVDELVISDLPDPCTARFRGAVSAGPIEVTGGELVLTCDVPGTLQVTIEAGVAFLPWSGTCEVI